LEESPIECHEPSWISCVCTCGDWDIPYYQKSHMKRLKGVVVSHIVISFSVIVISPLTSHNTYHSNDAVICCSPRWTEQWLQLYTATTDKIITTQLGWSIISSLISSVLGAICLGRCISSLLSWILMEGHKIDKHVENSRPKQKQRC
jgi:hypothetical protein